MRETGLNPAAVRAGLASAIDLIIHMEWLRDGSRKVASIAEVIGVQGETYALSEIFRLVSDEQETSEQLRPTGAQPTRRLMLRLTADLVDENLRQQIKALWG